MLPLTVAVFTFQIDMEGYSAITRTEEPGAMTTNFLSLFLSAVLLYLAMHAPQFFAITHMHDFLLNSHDVYIF